LAAPAEEIRNAQTRWNSGQERTAELQASNQSLRESEEKTRQTFEEIEALKSQLELRNDYLQEGGGSWYSASWSDEVRR
jgi:prefoldin subunit 5